MFIKSFFNNTKLFIFIINKITMLKLSEKETTITSFGLEILNFSTNIDLK